MKEEEVQAQCVKVKGAEFSKRYHLHIMSMAQTFANG
jgi:hypothetical protein